MKKKTLEEEAEEDRCEEIFFKVEVGKDKKKEKQKREIEKKKHENKKCKLISSENNKEKAKKPI